MRPVSKGWAFLIGQICLVVRVGEFHSWCDLIDRRFGFYLNLFSIGDTVCVVSNIDSHQEYCGPENWFG